jgi:type VII secretion integral membrane protein EccD
MPDQHCRVTVVGARRRVNLAVPAKAPIAEYVMTVARLCGETGDDSLPAVWSLATTGSAPLPLASSLDAAGISDGHVLYLRDIAAGEADEPVVLDIDEAVADASQRFSRWAWTPRARAMTELGLGGGWLTGTLIAVAVLSGRLPAGGLRLVSAMGVAAGIVSASLAAVARQRDWPVPTPLRLGLALSVVPEFAVAGAELAGHSAAPPLIALAAAAGAALGALFALAAAPGSATAGLAAVAAGALVVAGCLTALHATGIECAAAVAVAALGLSSLAPRLAARLVAAFPPGQRTNSPGVTADVRRARTLLAVWQSVLGTVEVVVLAWLAGSTQAFALALACCVSLALLLGASRYRQVADVLPGTVAGAAGLLATILQLPARLGGPWWAGPAACLAAGLVLVAAGSTGLFRDGERPGWPGWFTPASALLRIVSVPLLVGVFGVFGHLLAIGRQL